MSTDIRHCITILEGLNEGIRVRHPQFGVGEYAGIGDTPNTMKAKFNSGMQEVPFGSVDIVGPHRSSSEPSAAKAGKRFAWISGLAKRRKGGAQVA